jgi:hypothetical protein
MRVGARLFAGATHALLAHAQAHAALTAALALALPPLEAPAAPAAPPAAPVAGQSYRSARHEHALIFYAAGGDLPPHAMYEMGANCDLCGARNVQRAVGAGAGAGAGAGGGGGGGFYSCKRFCGYDECRQCFAAGAAEAAAAGAAALAVRRRPRLVARALLPSLSAALAGLGLVGEGGPLENVASGRLAPLLRCDGEAAAGSGAGGAGGERERPSRRRAPAQRPGLPVSSSAPVGALPPPALGVQAFGGSVGVDLLPLDLAPQHVGLGIVTALL